MIFDSNMSAASATNWDAVQESPYALGLEGGLMHVYENECNYNAIMKAAGISELKYYKETGGDLFVQEAGAAGGLIDRFIGFFKKVIEKIKQIFKKFFMVISSYISKDKDFVKKYHKEVFKNFKPFDFNGYQSLVYSSSTDLSSKLHTDVFSVKSYEVTDKEAADRSPYSKKTDDELENDANETRGKVLGKNAIDSSDFQEELHDAFYGGDKDEFKVSASMCETCFNIISDTKKNIKGAQDKQKEITDAINSWVKKLESAKNIVLKGNSNTGDDMEKGTAKIAGLNGQVAIWKERANIATTAYGALIGALKDANRQAKAICIKALNSGSRKDESAMLGGDIFAGVEII